jgi:serine/threonine protein phosphatase 1
MLSEILSLAFSNIQKQSQGLMSFLESWRKRQTQAFDHQPRRTLAVGDIHGCSMPLINLMEAAQPTPEDMVVYLGDYVDRGPDTRGVIDWIIQQADQLPVVTLRGNHEVMMLASRTEPVHFHNWQSVGGWETLESYDWDQERDWQGSVSAEHWDFLETTQPWIETSSHIFVHAHVDPSLPMKQQPDSQIYWEKCRSMELHTSGKKTVVGHTRQVSGIPREFPGGVCIDTAAVSGKWLTCLCAETGEY